ncbi:MAG: helix-turn-helix transcriptional regulator [Clostridia bacterium]|nr:helix-turn-helix transcriptional regulator [Clostridia bacterium]MBR6649911.1 helix-turn-helix transcriptional regulator [Clostridia bacterium]
MQNSFKELENVNYDRAPAKVMQFSKAPYARCFPLHWHDRIELLRVDHGELTVTCGSTNICIKEREIALFNSKEAHSAIAGSTETDYTCVMFELGPLVNNRYYGQNYIKPLLFRQMRFKNYIHDENISLVIDKLVEAYETNMPTCAIRIDAGILMLLTRLIEGYINTEPESSPRHSDHRFTEVIDYLDTHFTDNISIAELAKKFGYNKSYFCRKFKDQTGITCVEYISSLRLDYAAIMLKGTPYSVNEIAEKCGYPDANYFSRCFKEKYDMSPIEYKKNK